MAAPDYSLLTPSQTITPEQARNLAELVVTYTNAAPTTGGQHNLDGLADYIQRNGLQAGVDLLMRTPGVNFEVNISTPVTPRETAIALVDRLYKDADIGSDGSSHYQDWVGYATRYTPEETVANWNKQRAASENPKVRTSLSKITPEELEGFNKQAEEAKQALVQSDLNNFIKSANKIYEGFDLTPNYGADADAQKIIGDRLKQYNYNANPTDIERWNTKAQRYGLGQAIADLDRDLALRGFELNLPSGTRDNEYKNILLPGQLPSTYVGSPLYQERNYSETPAVDPVFGIAKPATPGNVLTPTGPVSGPTNIPIQGAVVPTLPQTSAATNIPIRGAVVPQLPTDRFIQQNLGTPQPTPAPVSQPQPQPQPQKPSIFSNISVPQPLVGTFGGQPLLQPPQPQPQQPQPQMTNEEFIQQQQPPVEMADGGSVSSSGVRRLKMSGYQEGGDVSNDEFIQEMMVGTAPSDESLQTTGEYVKGLYKENIPVHARVYLETLLGKKDPITAEDFTKEDLADIEKLLGSKPAKGAVTKYEDYEKVRDLDKEGRTSSDWLENLPSVGKTLGRFTYETLPDGRRVITDKYDFYNTSRALDVKEFEGMKPAEKALEVLKRITADRSVMDPPFIKRAADILGEAYIGRDGRPVKVEYDPKDLPVKRQEGSPPQGEITNDEFIKSLSDYSRKDLATIKEAIAEIGKNKDRYADLAKKGYKTTDIADPVKNAAYGLFLTSKTSEDPQRFLSTLSPFYDSKIEFDYTTDHSVLGEVQPYSTEARVYTTDDRGVALHELVHTLQMRRAKDIAKGKKEINPMSRTVGDKVFQRAADLAKKGEITFPATNWKQDKGELMANVYDMSRKYEEAGKDFTKSIEFKKLFPDEESRLYYYTQTLPDTSVMYPAGSSFEPTKTRDRSKSFARQLLGFADGGEITKFIKDNR